MPCLEKVAIPLSLSEEDKRVINFLTSFFQKGDTKTKHIKKFDLVHVLSTKSFITEHLQHLDIRAEILKKEKLEELKQEHVNQEIKPKMEEIAEKIRGFFPDVPVETHILSGVPCEEIVKFVKRNKVKSLFLYKKEYSKIKDLVFSDIFQCVLYSFLNKITFIIGSLFKRSEVSIKNLVIPVDKSDFSKEAISLVAEFYPYLRDIEKIWLIHVINVERIEYFIQRKKDPEERGIKILENAKKSLVKAGYKENQIDTVLETGVPKEKICSFIREINPEVVCIGRKGRNKIKDLVLGSVSGAVIYECKKPAIIILDK